MTQKKKAAERQARIEKLQQRQESYKVIGSRLSKTEKAELTSLMREQKEYEDFTEACKKAQKELFGW